MPFDIKNIRALTGLDQKRFGEKIGLNERQIRRRETGETAWTMDEIIQVCKVFDLDLQLKGLTLKG